MNQEPLVCPTRQMAPRAWILTSIVAILAALCSWGLGELALATFRPTVQTILAEAGVPRTASSIHAATIKLERAFVRQSATFSYGALGGLLGLGLGLAGGLTRRSPKHAVAAAGVGLALGAATGALTAAPLVNVYFRDIDWLIGNVQEQGLLVPLAVHVGLWVPLSAAAGMALGIGLGGAGRALRALVGAALGAAAATVLFEFGGSFGLPSGATAEPIPTEMPLRLLAHALVATCAATGALALVFHLVARAVPIRDVQPASVDTANQAHP
jgi:hypothetical protein